MLSLGIGTAAELYMDTCLGVQLDLLTEMGNTPVSYSD